MTLARATSKVEWERQGFVPAVEVLAPAEVTEYRRLFDDLEQRVGRDAAEIKLQSRHFEDEFVWRLATHPRVLDPLEAVLGPDVLLLSTHFFCKYPAQERGERFVAWHQDVTYWGLEPPKAMTGWLAIDDADVENGCMMVIPGSHRAGVLTHGTAHRAGNLLSINQEVPPPLVDETRAVSIPLRAGQMSLHDGMLLHASHPNRSTRRRCGLAIRFTTPDVRQVEVNSLGHRWSAVLVRGVDRYHNFPAREVPWRG